MRGSPASARSTAARSDRSIASSCSSATAWPPRRLRDLRRRVLRLRGVARVVSAARRPVGCSHRCVVLAELRVRDTVPATFAERARAAGGCSGRTLACLDSNATPRVDRSGSDRSWPNVTGPTGVGRRAPERTLSTPPAPPRSRNSYTQQSMGRPAEPDARQGADRRLDGRRRPIVDVTSHKNSSLAEAAYRSTLPSRRARIRR